MMIESIRHKGLRLFWEENDASKLPAAHVGKIRLVLTLLNSAGRVEDASFPGSGLHPLKGTYAGFWALKITGNYRIIFRFKNENVYDVDYLDYH
jgi:proteic killer suppression protein